MKVVRNILTGLLAIIFLFHPYFILRLLGRSHEWIRVQDMIGVVLTECFVVLVVFSIHQLGSSFYKEK
jgi:hypothetical protein